MPRGGTIGNKGGGRKKAAATLLREQYLQQQEQHARNAFEFHIETMNDDDVERALRLQAAKEVMRRVWGDKAETVVSGDVLIRVIREQRNFNQVADSASSAAAD